MSTHRPFFSFRLASAGALAFGVVGCSGASSPESATEDPSELRAASPCRQVGTKQECVYRTVQGLSLKMDVHRRPGSDVRPGLLWIHGGALIFGSRSELPREQLNRYLDAGYVVASIDYRLAPETKLGEIHSDIEAAYNWLAGEGARLLSIAPDRIGIIGHSAGGYLSLMAGTNRRLSPRPKAIASFYGYGGLEWYRTPISGDDPVNDDILDAIGSRPIASTSKSDESRYELYGFFRQTGRWIEFVMGPGDVRLYEPVHHLANDYPPTILFHGERDDDVPFAQSRSIERELKRLGVPVELQSNPRWEHGFDEQSSDPSVRAAFTKLIAFLDCRLKPNGSGACPE
jgi:acetyl esterase/lipase